MGQDRIASGRMVSIRYLLRDGDGHLLADNRTSGAPHAYLHGARWMIPAVEYALHGRSVGEQLSLVVPPEETLVREEAANPIVGKALHFDHLEIVEVKEATGAELAEAGLFFPTDVLQHPRMPGPVGELIQSVRRLSMTPPFPWGQHLYARVFESACASLPGDVIELGVGLGGMSIFLARLASAAGKHVYSHDSYQGLPAPGAVADNPYFMAGDYGANAAYGSLLERFEREIDRFGLRGAITPVPGWFEDTLPRLPADRRFCFAHLDSDLYQSVKLSLEAVYDRIPDGGVIVIDDFFHHAMGPRRAASDFFNRRGVTPVHHVSFPYSVFIIKGEHADAGTPRSIDGCWYSFDWLRSDAGFVDTVRASVRLAEKADPAAAENARLFLEILERRSYRSSDVYAYWKALERFWDPLSSSDGKSRGPVRL